MSRKSADEISSGPELHGRYAPRAEASMSAATRDELIVKLWNERVSVAAIAKRVGMTPRGVRMAITRIREGRTGRITT